MASAKCEDFFFPKVDSLCRQLVSQALGATRSLTPLESRGKTSWLVLPPEFSTPSCPVFLLTVWPVSHPVTPLLSVDVLQGIGLCCLWKGHFQKLPPWGHHFWGPLPSLFFCSFHWSGKNFPQISVPIPYLFAFCAHPLSPCDWAPSLSSPVGTVFGETVSSLQPLNCWQCALLWVSARLMAVCSPLWVSARLKTPLSFPPRFPDGKASWLPKRSSPLPVHCSLLPGRAGLRAPVSAVSQCQGPHLIFCFGWVFL